MKYTPIKVDVLVNNGFFAHLLEGHVFGGVVMATLAYISHKVASLVVAPFFGGGSGQSLSHFGSLKIPNLTETEDDRKFIIEIKKVLDCYINKLKVEL